MVRSCHHISYLYQFVITIWEYLFLPVFLMLHHWQTGSSIPSQNNPVQDSIYRGRGQLRSARVRWCQLGKWNWSSLSHRLHVVLCGQPHLSRFKETDNSRTLLDQSRIHGCHTHCTGRPVAMLPLLWTGNSLPISSPHSPRLHWRYHSVRGSTIPSLHQAHRHSVSFYLFTY